MPKRLPLAIRLWFAADLALALLPPVHWVFGSGAPMLGAPGVIVYFLGASVFFSASVLAAYACDPSLGDVVPDLGSSLRAGRDDTRLRPDSKGEV